jgi:DNA transposition AAA+ family ATPase
VQLETCRTLASSRILCAEADIGKTHTAKYYADNNKNVVYVDCSQVKTRAKLVKFIAKGFGVNSKGRYSDVYEDLVYYIKTLDNPLIILDEFGDLEYNAFLEMKALWNAVEHYCGWYMMGADGLKHKIDKRIASKKVGYTELFSRLGNKYQKPTPDDAEGFKKYKIANAAMIIKANFPEGINTMATIAEADYTLRNLRDVRKKINV